MSELKTSEVLDLAADVVEQRGWTTGTWNNTREGAPVCIEGGIAAAIGLGFNLGEVGDAEYQAFRQCPAYVAVSEYLGIEEGFLYSWNDDVLRADENEIVHAHSQAEVIEVLRAAAAVERAKEESLEGAEAVTR